MKKYWITIKPKLNFVHLLEFMIKSCPSEFNHISIWDGFNEPKVRNVFLWQMKKLDNCAKLRNFLKFTYFSALHRLEYIFLHPTNNSHNSWAASHSAQLRANLCCRTLKYILVVLPKILHGLTRPVEELWIKFSWQKNIS